MKTQIEIDHDTWETPNNCYVFVRHGLGIEHSRDVVVEMLPLTAVKQGPAIRGSKRQAQATVVKVVLFGEYLRLAKLQNSQRHVTVQPKSEERLARLEAMLNKLLQERADESK